MPGRKGDDLHLAGHMTKEKPTSTSDDSHLAADGIDAFTEIQKLEAIWASKIQELEAIWASNSGDKHPSVTMAQGSSEGGRGIKRQCEEGHAEPNSGAEQPAVTKRMTHASCGDRRQPKRPSQEEHAHMPPRKRMRWKQPAPSGSGQPPANSSRGSTQLGGHTMSYQWGPMREPTGQFEVVASCGNDLLHGARGRVTGGVGCVSGEFSPPAHRPHAASAHARCRDA